MFRFLFLFSILAIIISCNWDLQFVPISEINSTLPFKCGESFLDRRDTIVYQTVWIDEDGGSDNNKPGQCWMAENLRTGICIGKDHLGTIRDDATIHKFCQEHECDLCLKYGGYYLWAEAMDYEFGKKITQGICPTGWHLPSGEEFEMLKEAVNENASNILIDGINISGLSIPKTGYMNFVGNFDQLNFSTYLWSSSPSPTSSDSVYILRLKGSEIEITDRYFTARKDHGLCVRCIKD